MSNLTFAKKNFIPQRITLLIISAYICSGYIACIEDNNANLESDSAALLSISKKPFHPVPDPFPKVLYTLDPVTSVTGGAEQSTPQLMVIGLPECTESEGIVLIENVGAINEKEIIAPAIINKVVTRSTDDGTFAALIAVNSGDTLNISFEGKQIAAVQIEQQTEIKDKKLIKGFGKVMPSITADKLTCPDINVADLSLEITHVPQIDSAVMIDAKWKNELSDSACIFPILGVNLENGDVSETLFDLNGFQMGIKAESGQKIYIYIMERQLKTPLIITIP